MWYYIGVDGDDPKGEKMITSYSDEKMTPKQKAKEIVADGLDKLLDYWIDDVNTENQTEREIELVRGQIEKIVDRINKKYL